MKRTIKNLFPAPTDSRTGGARLGARMLPAPTHLRRLFVALVALLTMTAQTAWAEDVNITAKGQTIENATWSNCTVNIEGSSEVTFSGVITISGDVTLNLGKDATLNANSGIRVNVRDKLTINGPGTLNAGHEGYQHAAIGSEKGKKYGEIVINGGTINLNTSKQISAACIGGGNENPYSPNSKITINGGSITASESGYFSIGSGHCGSMGHILIKGGQINVHKIGGDYWNNNNSNDTDDSSLTLDWTNETDFIQSDYNLDSKYTPNITMSIAEGKYFKYVDENNNDVGATIKGGTPNFGGKKIVPRHPSNLANSTVSGIRGSYALHSAGVTLDYSVTAFLGESALTEGTDYTTALAKDGTSKPIDMQDGKYILTETGTYTLSITGTNTYHGTKTIAFSVVDPLELTAETTTLDATVSTAYRVNENLSIDNRLTVTGDVTLVLNAGQTLTLSQGVNVAEGQTLTIEGAGALISTGTGGNAAIGGNSGASHGNIIINGGMITATASDASGIGRGKNGGNSGSVVLGWTNATDFVDATYDSNNLSIAAGKQFIFADEIAFATTSNISGRKIVPFLGNNCLDYATVSINPFFPYSAQGTSISYTVTAHEGTDALVEGTDYTTEVKKGEDIINKTGDAYSLTSEGDYTLTITGTGDKFGSKTVGFSVVKYLPVTTTTETLEGSFNVPFKVTEDVTVSNRIAVSGDVKLILDAGTTLTANKGIGVEVGNTLTIDGEGTLIATGGSQQAGIGGSTYLGEYGHIIINGGTVQAKGGDEGAGIGGAEGNKETGRSRIEINGGIVSATGGTNAAGIGGGYDNSNGDKDRGLPGTIVINGGQVTASSIGFGAPNNQTHPNYTTGSLTLGWTNESDFIQASLAYDMKTFTRFAEGKRFTFEGNQSDVASVESLNDSWKIVPINDYNLAFADVIKEHNRYLYTGEPITIPCTVTTPNGVLLKEGVHYEVKYKQQNSDVEMDNVTGYGYYYLIVKGKEPYFGKKENTKLSFYISNAFNVIADTDELNDFTYVVNQDVTNTRRIEVKGNSTLILNEGKTLTASSGICVPAGSSLTIKGSGMLIANAPVINNELKEWAAIGGGNRDLKYIHGNITIEGGTIIATGGTNSAAIGNASLGNDNGAGVITITGGKVTATGGKNAAAIGGGYPVGTAADYYSSNGTSGPIVITGGQVTAQSNAGGGTGIGKAVDATGAGSSLTLGWTNSDDFIYASSYNVDNISFVEEKTFIFDEDYTEVTSAEGIGGKTIRPSVYLNNIVSYVDPTVEGDNKTKTVFATPLTGSETTLASGWYVVNKDVDYTTVNDNTVLNATGDVNLILADGKTMTVGSSETPQSFYGISMQEGSKLTIYGQGGESEGSLKVYSASDTPSIDGNNNSAFTLYGGHVVTSTSIRMQHGSGSVAILGGSYTDLREFSQAGAHNSIEAPSITLGWTNSSDVITTSGYLEGNLTFVEGKRFYAYEDENIAAVYDGNTTFTKFDNSYTDFAGKTLRPCADYFVKTVEGVTASATGGESVTIGTETLYKVASGAEVTLSATDSDNKKLSSVTLSDGTATGSDGTFTFTMGTSDVTVTAATFLEKVSYFDPTAEGNDKTKTVYATPLTGSETTLAAGWYVVNKDVDYTTVTNNDVLNATGDVNLILANDKTMNIGSEENPVEGRGINFNSTAALAIYGQGGTTEGSLSIYTGNYSPIPNVGDITIYGGNLTVGSPLLTVGKFTIHGGTFTDARTNGSNAAINAAEINIRGGKVESEVSELYTNDKGTGNINISGGVVNVLCLSAKESIAISGGQVTIGANGIYSKKDLTLSWTDAESDFIASGGEFKSEGGSISIAPGKHFLAYNSENTIVAVYDAQTLPEHDASNFYSFDGKTLKPALKITLPEGVTATGTDVFTSASETAGTYAIYGAKVTLSGTATAGYTFSFTVKDASNNDVTVESNGFTMPATDVTVTATETAIPATAPSITAQPAGLSLSYGYPSGSTLSVTASAADGHALSYQWYSSSSSSASGTAISGATAASYDVPTGLSVGSTYYYCVVTATRSDNSETATATSSVATVTVSARTVESANGVTITQDEGGYTATINEESGDAAVISSSILNSNGKVTIASLTYNRTLTAPTGTGEVTIDNQAANLYTTCMPTAPTTDGGKKYYSLSGADGTTLSFTEVAQPAAYTPYLVAVFAGSNATESSSGTGITLSKEVSGSSAGGYVLKGTLTGLSNAEARGKYILQSGGKWGQVKSGSVIIPPFRAYIEATGAGARLLESSFGDDATGIRSMRTIDRDGTERWYDLQGRRIDKTVQQGVYIHNGRKEVRR